MKVMKENQNWISSVIWIYLFLSPIFDVITSFSIHYFSKSMPLILTIKFLFLIFLFVLNVKEKKSIWYTALLGIYFLFFFLLLYFTKGTSSFFLEAQNLFRTFYFPCVLLFLFLLQKEGLFSVSIPKMCYLLFSYLFFLVVPELFGLGFSSYAITKVGSLGWFYSTNEISGILAILFPFLIVYLKDKNWTIRILSMLFYLAGIFVIGTKVPILAFGITIMCFFATSIIHLWKNKEWKKIGIRLGISLIALVCFSCVLFTSSFYKNIKTHLEFLEIREVSDLFTFHHIDHFIFSERLSFLQDTNQIYASSTFSQKLLGIGIVEFQDDVPISKKMIEMDYFDVFYHYGILGMLLFFLPFFLISFRRKYFLEEKISIFLIFLLAFFSGHILVAPSVSTLAVCILLPKEEEMET